MSVRLRYARGRVRYWRQQRTRADSKIKAWQAKVRLYTPHTATGIDVSMHQGTPSWQAVKAAGIDFAYVKATEGAGYRDPQFAVNVEGARAAGLKVGAYHFLRPVTGRPRGAATEIMDFVTALDVARLGRGDLRPVLDIEVTEFADRGGTIVYARDALVALQRATGLRPILYTYPAFLDGQWHADFSALADLWIAHPDVAAPTLPAPWTRYVAWQRTFKGRVAGITGDVDMNVAHDINDLIA